jgi:hypothetical protein
MKGRGERLVLIPPFCMSKYSTKQKYLRKIGTKQVFIHTPALAARPDMEPFDPFSHDHQKKNLEDPDYSLNSFVKEVSGKTREHIREGLAQCKNRKQKVLWCLYHIFEKTTPKNLHTFNPKYREISAMMGPHFHKEDLAEALEAFKKNPGLAFIMSDAIQEFERPITDIRNYHLKQNQLKDEAANESSGSDNQEPIPAG